MSISPKVWPPSTEQILAFLGQVESASLEFKREWYDLKKPAQKGEFVRDVLALANCTSPDRMGLLIVGVDDPKRGGSIVGIPTGLDADQMAQILEVHTLPVPELRLQHYTLEGSTVAVIGVEWTADYPYFAIRKVGEVLSRDRVYTRRSGTVSHLSVPELERILREKQVRVGSEWLDRPIEFGFVDRGSWTGSTGPILRLRNMTQETLTGLSVFFDVIPMRRPDLALRIGSLHGASLRPSEEREVELHLGHLQFFFEGQRHLKGTSQGDRWMDVYANVEYRDRLGFLQYLKCRCAMRE